MSETTRKPAEGMKKPTAKAQVLLPPPALTELLGSIQALQSAADLRRGLEEVADALHRYVAYDNLGVLLLDPRGRELRFALARGYAPEVEEHWRFGLGQGLVGIAAQSGEAIMVEDVRQDPRYISAAHPTRAELALPLKVKDRVIGVLDLGAIEPGVFGPEQLALLEPVAGQLAARDRRCAAHPEPAPADPDPVAAARVGARVHLDSRPQEAARAGGGPDPAADPLRRLLGHAVERGDAVCSSLSCRSTGKAAWSRPPARPAWARASAAPPRRCGRPCASPTCSSTRATSSACATVRCAPSWRCRCTSRSGWSGCSTWRAPATTLSPRSTSTPCRTLAASLAIALENARLYGRLQDDEQRLADDLSTAREIQKQLLPKTTPWLPGLQVAFAYRPANHLGGDFYDIRPYGEGRVAIAAGDVSGKATSAALYGSLAIGMLRQYPADGLRPSALLRDMNYKLLDLGIDNRFLALALGIYDSGDRSLVLANSGLPHPYLIRGGEVTPIKVAGVPLGLLPDRRYEEELVTLETGDVVVIATDGIDESHNRNDEEFGHERVRQTLADLAGGSARAIADGLLKASRAWAGGAEAWDDSTVVVLKAV